MRTQASSIAVAASNIAAATTAVTIATCHRRRSCPQDDRPSGLWPLALMPIAIHAAVRRHCSLLLLQFDAAELRAMTSPFGRDRAMINAQTARVKYAESCAVRAVVMLLVVIGDGLEPAANTLLLHVSLVLQ